MTDTEIINRIIAKMSPEQHYRFLDLWVNASGETLQEIRWGKGQKRVFKTMTDNKLIRHIRNDGTDEIVELKDKGIKIKEAGGLKFDIENIKGKFWTLGKKLFLWLTLGGLATWLLVWDRWIDPMINNKTNQQEKIIIPDSSTKEKPKEIQIVQDSSKTDSKKNHAPDSLDND